MSDVHLRLSIQQMPSGKHTATIRSEGQGIPYGLTRGFDARVDAERWLIENAKAELASPTHDEAA